MFFFLFVLQKSLWDSIKNKKEGEKVAAPRRKKVEPSLKMAANKTFQVSRKPQYKRDKPRSPLASLNEGKAVRERSLPKLSPADVRPRKSEEHKAFNPNQRQQSAPLMDQENDCHIQTDFPVVLLSPAGPDALGSKPENRDLAKMLNRTMSPIGTPERFKSLMPHIQSESPAPAAAKSSVVDVTELARTPVLSLKDALALIDSDLSPVSSSPRDVNSSSDFSDSLESKTAGHDRDVQKALPDSPEPSESNEPRLTFFVSKKVVVSVSEADTSSGLVKKTSFTSATVTKSKAPVEEPNSSLSGRKIKKSRRRLLEKTLELTDGSVQCESRPNTPKLPVIDLDAGAKGWQSPAASCPLSPAPVTFPITSPPPAAPTRFSFSSVTPPPPAISFTVASPSPSGSFSPLHRKLSSSPKVDERLPAVSAPSPLQEESFPIHMVVKSKKRKSEEFLKGDTVVEDGGKTDRLKRSKVAAVKAEASRTMQERRSVSQRQQQRAAGEPDLNYNNVLTLLF